jgi:Flp pilus assembly pilin Flp
MLNLLKRLYRDEEAATAVEYAIIAAVIGLAAIVADVSTDIRRAASRSFTILSNCGNICLSISGNKEPRCPLAPSSPTQGPTSRNNSSLPTI